VKRLALILVSIGVSLVLIEIALRLFFPQPLGPVQFAVDPDLGFIPVPNQRAVRTLPGVYAYRYSNNSMGLRGPEIHAKTKPRILVLGDSFTYGIGVNDDETFCSILQSQLPGNEIINAGNPGKGTDYALKFYRTKGKQLEPDVVILVFCVNDFSDNQLNVYYAPDLTPKVLRQQKPFITRLAIYDWVITHSHVAGLLKSLSIKKEVSAADRSHIQPSPTDEQLTEKYLRALLSDVPSLKIFYIAPHDQNGVPEQEAFKRVCERLKVTPTYLQIGAEDNLAEGHWKPSGHRKAAQIILSTLSR
jgi:GDSL-like lipase/acylhydrolase family protein